MNDFIVALLFDFTVFAIAGIAFAVWYRMTLGKDAQLKAYQYRFFALRDRAIRLAVSGQMKEDDPQWQALYKHMNDSAREASVNSMRNGFSFVLGMLRNLRPLTSEEIDKVESLPEDAKLLTIDFVNTVLRICMEGSFLLRRIVWLAEHIGKVKRWLERRNPQEVRNYRVWAAQQKRLASAAC